MSNEAVINRIKKLMNLANSKSDGNEEERDTALNLIAKLVTKYRIDMASISNDSETTTTSSSFKEMSAPWVRNIINAICRMNFCDMYYIRHGNSYCYYHVVGNEVEIEATINLCQHIIKSVSKESRNKAKLYPHDKSYKRSFESAASSRISHRIKEIITQVIECEEKENSSTALVLINQYEKAKEDNARYLENTNIKVVTKNYKLKTQSYNGHVDGHNYGNTVNISN